MATGETGREEEQDAKSPHWVSESCSFVRYPALLFPTLICLVSCVGRRRGGSSSSRQAVRLVEQVQRIFFFVISFFSVVSVGSCCCCCSCSCSCWSCSPCQGLLAQLFSFRVPMRTALTCSQAGGVGGVRLGRAVPQA